MKKYSLVILAVVIIFLVYFGAIKTLSHNGIKYSQLVINDKVINIEIADTDAKRSLGLGERENLAEDYGMLFVFSEKKQYGFWMKGMQFPLDIIWIDDAKIVDISKNLPVEENNLTTYKPKVPVNYVLEVNAGYADKNNIKIGDMVEFKL